MTFKIAILRGGTILLFFLTTAGVVSVLKGNLWYLLLFGGIGLFAGFTEFAMAMQPDKSQIIRKCVLFSLGITLASLAISIGINFQFSQVCFDIYSGIITGAIIQLIVARIIFPLFFGNAFCSRACWDSAVFEIADRNNNKEGSDSKLSAWVFMALIILASFIISLYYIPKSGTDIMRTIFIAENAVIIFLGLVLSKFYGRRTYCRKLCPFIAISGLISRFSLFKISPLKNNTCISCGKCNEICPMGIDVEKYVREKKRINHPNCIVCEKCVNICPEKCLSLDIKCR